MVLKSQLDGVGQAAQYKACLFPKEYLQIFSIDNDETFAAVMSFSTLLKFSRS